MSDALRNLVRFAVATFLLAVGLVLSGGTARATCGDHVRIVTPTADGDTAPPAMPCQGPNCTNAPPPQPPLSVPTKVVLPPTEWAATAAAMPLVPADGAGRIVADSDGRPIRRSSSQFHPPRSR